MVYFVYRSVYEGPSGRLVRHFPDATVLDWFRRVWDDAASQDAYTWVQRELGANVYGLHTIFETGLPAPRTHNELRRLLKEHLYVEGRLRVDRHSVRVLTDDDEVELAYFFVDDHVVADEPDRWTYLVHESWDLPADASPSVRTFTPPVPVDVVNPAPPGREGVTPVARSSGATTTWPRWRSTWTAFSATGSGSSSTTSGPPRIPRRPPH